MLGRMQTAFCAACDIAVAYTPWQKGHVLSILQALLRTRAPLSKGPALLAAMLYQFAWLLHNVIKVRDVAPARPPYMPSGMICTACEVLQTSKHLLTGQDLQRSHAACMV